MEIPLKKIYHMTQKSHYWAYALRKPELKRHINPTFIAALFTIPRIWMQPTCPSTDENMKKMWYVHTHTHTHNGILLSHIKEQI